MRKSECTAVLKKAKKSARKNRWAVCAGITVMKFTSVLSLKSVLSVESVDSPLFFCRSTIHNYEKAMNLPAAAV